MKMIIKTSLLIAVFGMFSFTASAVSETITFSVNGTVACEAQIETIITSLDGVTSVSWDATTKIITIVFDNETIKKDRFYVALAEGGYDNQELHAKKAHYDELPAACKYVREVEKD
jgi:copper chaperone CopZ